MTGYENDPTYQLDRVPTILVKRVRYRKPEPIDGPNIFDEIIPDDPAERAKKIKDLKEKYS